MLGVGLHLHAKLGPVDSLDTGIVVNFVGNRYLTAKATLFDRKGVDARTRCVNGGREPSRSTAKHNKVVL